MQVPPDWELVAVDGDRRAGSVRLMDERAVRLEARWSEGKSGTAAAVVSDHLREISRRARRQRAELKVERNVNAAAFADPGVDFECYEWRAEQKAVGLVRRCPACGRTVHVQVSGEAGEQLRGRARRIFSSVRDHPDDGWELWAFYDLSFDVPEAFRLDRADLKTGCVTCRFSRRRDELELSRVSLAHIALRNTDLEGWARSFAAGTLARFRVAAEEGRLASHPAVTLAGRARWTRDGLGLFLGWRRLRLAAWRCEDRDRLLCCALSGRRIDDEAFAAIVARVRCHGAEGGGP